MSDRAFPFIRMNEREGKPRTHGITEIRGPYYTPMSLPGTSRIMVPR